MTGQRWPLNSDYKMVLFGGAYTQTDVRECGDIDIYSGENYAAVNACFEKHGLQVEWADSHHVHINIDGV